MWNTGLHVKYISFWFRIVYTLLFSVISANTSDTRDFLLRYTVSDYNKFHQKYLIKYGVVSCNFVCFLFIYIYKILFTNQFKTDITFPLFPLHSFYLQVYFNSLIQRFY